MNAEIKHSIEDGPYVLALIGEQPMTFAESDDMLAALAARYPRAVYEEQDGSRNELRVWSNRVWQMRDEEGSEAERYAHIVGVILL